MPKSAPIPSPLFNREANLSAVRVPSLSRIIDCLRDHGYDVEPGDLKPTHLKWDGYVGCELGDMCVWITTNPTLWDGLAFFHTAAIAEWLTLTLVRKRVWSIYEAVVELTHIEEIAVYDEDVPLIQVASVLAWVAWPMEFVAHAYDSYLRLPHDHPLFPKAKALDETDQSQAH